MSNNTTYSSCPIVKIENAQLVDRVLGGVNNQAYFVPFEQKILWLRETDAVVSYWHGGKLFHEGSSFNDFYGFFSSYESALESAKATQESYKIDGNSSLEIRIHMNVVDFPVMEDTSASATSWNSTAKSKLMYQSLPDNKNWFYDDKLLIQKYQDAMKSASEEEDGFDARFKAYDIIENLKLQSKRPASKVLVWSSQSNQEESFNQLKQDFMLALTK